MIYHRRPGWVRVGPVRSCRSQVRVWQMHGLHSITAGGIMVGSLGVTSNCTALSGFHDFGFDLDGQGRWGYSASPV